MMRRLILCAGLQMCFVLAAFAADRASAIEPGSGRGFKDCEVCPEMVVVPKGEFIMGSPKGEPGHTEDVEPQHKVTIGSPFAVGKFAVTYDEWDACVAEGGCNGYRPDDQGWGRGKRPVTLVSWMDAKAYVSWLAKKTGKPYRLLTEAEREYVTRAGTTTPFWWGSSIAPEQANYDGTFAYTLSGKRGLNRAQTVPVDSFEPNPWGLYQVHGNVQEWVEDCWTDNYEGAPADGTAKTAPNCKYRALRGGSWASIPHALAAAARSWDYPIVRSFNAGFRVARPITP